MTQPQKYTLKIQSILLFSKIPQCKTNPETTSTQKCASTCTQVHACTQTPGLNVSAIWGMLNIYLSCLPGWLHQSAPSVWLPINCLKILHCLAATVTLRATTLISTVSTTSAMGYFSFFPPTDSIRSSRAYRCMSIQAIQVFGRETNTWKCNAVTPWWMSTTNRCLKALFNPSVPENWSSTARVSLMWPTKWRPLHTSGFMAMCCCNTNVFNASQTGSTPPDRYA